MLTDTGAVFTWGATSFGRLGLHDQSTKNVTKPTRVTTLDHFAVHGLASGDFHMLALTRDRRVFSWGYGAEGQCGHGNSLHLRTPRPVEALRHVLVSKIGCGAWYSAAVSADGYLYTWGYGDGGWLGQEPPKGESRPPI
jgi:alpha-tubulin suppressor-like RCC1 family protein